MTPPSNPGALVIDANIAVAISSNEQFTDVIAAAELARYSSLGYEFFAPGVIVSETLYVLCGKLQNGVLTSTEHAQSILDFEVLMGKILSPPDGEVALIARAEAIRGSYSCRRSADGIYIALAEMLSATRPTTLLTFDADMQKQATNSAPSVTVQLLTI
jgi:predicted nucleic acid-binding protein